MTDSADMTYTYVTEPNGNFHGLDPVMLPLTSIKVSDCTAAPNAKVMGMSDIPTATGTQLACNSCHTSGGTTSGIHLP